MKQPEISYSFFIKWKSLLIAGVSVGLLQIAAFVFYKGQASLLWKTLSTPSLFFKRLVVDLLLIESLSVLILFFLSFKLGRYFAKNPPRSLGETAGYNLRYFLLVLVSILIFVPIAISLRHFWRNDLTIETEMLLRNFRHFKKMYLQTILPLTIIGHLYFNMILFSKKALLSTKANGEASNFANNYNYLEVINDNGNLPIRISSILWIEREARSCWVQTSSKRYLVRKTLKELEELLNPKGFIRINRATIVNRDCVYNYSYWEYDKFILRMNDDEKTEFIVSRDRMKQIKDQLTQPT